MFRKVSISTGVSGVRLPSSWNYVLVSFDLQLLPHTRPVGTVQSVLIQPFDVEAQTAEREKDHVELSD